LVICDINGPGLSETEQQIRNMGREVTAYQVDVADREAMRQLADTVHAGVEADDILMNNAGVAMSAGLLDTSLDDWDWIVGINLWGVIYGCHFFVPRMVKRARGGFVNPNIPIPLGLVRTFLSDHESFFLTQNLMLLGQAMGLGAWIHVSTPSAYLFDGQGGKVGTGLGFRMHTPEKKWRRWPPLPANQPNPVGIDGVLEGLCPPYVTVDEAVDQILEQKYGSKGAYGDTAIFNRAYQESRDGKTFLAGNETRAAGDRPALHDAVELEAKIVVQAARRVLLNNELIALAAARTPARLRRHIELALLAIDLKAHGRRPLACPLDLLALRRSALGRG